MSDTMTVGQIAGLVERDESRLHTTLGDITVADNGRNITIRSPQTDPEGNDIEATTREFEFDEVVERSFSKFLDVNPTYMSKCPSELKAYNFNYWLRKSPEVQAMLMVGPKGIETMYDPDDTIVTVPEIAAVISRVFQPSDEIVSLYSDPDKFHVDIQVADHIQVTGNGLGDRPTAEGLLIRPGQEIEDVATAPRVFDITHGGVRIVSHPSRAKAPTIERYFNRLICTNGLTMPVADRQVTLRGNTVQEVLDEIESIAGELMADMPRALQSYADLANMEVPGNPLAYIRQIGKEMGIPDRIVGKALDYAGAANFGRADVPVTSYDVLQIFTALANNESVRYGTGRKLQNLGGILVHRGEEMNHRCAACERPLV